MTKSSLLLLSVTVLSKSTVLTYFLNICRNGNVVMLPNWTPLAVKHVGLVIAFLVQNFGIK